MADDSIKLAKEVCSGDFKSYSEFEAFITRRLQQILFQRLKDALSKHETTEKPA